MGLYQAIFKAAGRQPQKSPVRREYRPMAERRIKRDLLLDAIARAESVTVSDEEIEGALRGTAEADTPPPETERLLRSSEHRDRARAHLAIRHSAGRPDPRRERRNRYAGTVPGVPRAAGNGAGL